MNPEEAFAQARSGSGYRCSDVAAIAALQSYAGGRKAWIDLVEVFECDGDLEIPRIELGIYGDHGAYGLPAQQRSRLASDRLAGMLEATAREERRFIFQIWLDWDD